MFFDIVRAEDSKAYKSKDENFSIILKFEKIWQKISSNSQGVKD